MSDPRFVAQPESPTPPPVPPLPTATPTSPTSRRPPQVVVAVLFMAPAAVIWLIAGVGFLIATARTEGSPKSLLWILAIAILALCLLLVLMTLTGMWQAWQGRSTLLRIPAGFTLGLFVLALVNLLVQGRLDYKPTMTTPLAVGALAGVALILLSSGPAERWLRGGLR